jgi:16S rRNA (uracil1498-N3)-methyltransferase
MSRFFIKRQDIDSGAVCITGEDVIHIKKVLRLKIGDTIIVSDGCGTDYLVKIKEIDDSCVYADIIHTMVNLTEPPIDIVLFQGVPKSDKMDFIIQKSVELGVRKIIPVITERTIVRIDNKKDAQKKHERWNRISLEASKQCNRGFVPEVSMPVCYEEAFNHMNDSDLIIIPYEKETAGSFKKILKNNIDIKSVSVIVGPEGGFTEKEVEKALGYGANAITLGPRILRTETAGITVLSILMYELGDVGYE